MPKILMVVDASGEGPVLVDDDEVLMPGPGVSWRFVCDVDDRAQGRAVLEQLRQRRGAPARPPESPPLACCHAAGMTDL